MQAEVILPPRSHEKQKGDRFMEPTSLPRIRFLCREETASAFETAMPACFGDCSLPVNIVIAEYEGAAAHPCPQNARVFLLEDGVHPFPKSWRNQAEYAFTPPHAPEAILRHIALLSGNPPSQPSYDRIRRQGAACLTSLHIPRRLLAHKYLLEGIMQLFSEPIPTRSRLLQSIYKEIAEKYHSSPVMVDRAIRHGVEACWKNTPSSRLKSLFGYDAQDLLGMPTNGEFLYALYEHLRERLAFSTGTERTQ